MKIIFNKKEIIEALKDKIGRMTIGINENSFKLDGGSPNNFSEITLNNENLTPKRK